MNNIKDQENLSQKNFIKIRFKCSIKKWSYH